MRRLTIRPRGRGMLIVLAAAIALVAAACHPVPQGTTTGTINFEDPPYSTGTIDGQDGWQSTGAAGGGCGFPYDHEVSTGAVSGTTPGNFAFGSQSLRISNAVTSGCFDGTFSRETVDQSGETGFDTGGGQHSTGVRRGYYEASWSFATAGNPFAEQENLVAVASPDRGDGARMSWVQMADCDVENNAAPPFCLANGLEVNFFEYDEDVADFVPQNVVSGLSRSTAHTIRVRMFFFEGRDNDAVQVCVDGTNCFTGGSWEDYFRDTLSEQNGITKSVDSLLLRTGGADGVTNPLVDGNGFFIDNLEVRSFDYTGANLSVSGPTTVPEGNSGTTDAAYTITLSEPLPFDVSVNYTTVNGAATAPSDYTTTSGTATFVAGDTSESVLVPIVGDTTDEPHEDFALRISNAVAIGRETGAASGTFVRIHVASKSTSIQDEESTIRINDASISEGQSGTSLLPFVVTLDNASSVPVTVRFDTQNQTATAPSDYTARVNVILTFSPGQTSKPADVTVKGDITVEPDETLRGNLSAQTNATIGDSFGIGAILTDD